MQTKTYRMILLLIIVLIAAAVFAAFQMQPKKSAPKEAAPVQAAYFLKEYEEKIGVFRPETAEPIMMIDVYVSNLPAADQQELRNGGIQVADDSKLQTMIEDFES